MAPWYVCDAACPVPVPSRSIGLRIEERVFWADPGIDDPNCPRCQGCCNARVDEVVPQADRERVLRYIRDVIAAQFQSSSPIP